MTHYQKVTLCRTYRIRFGRSLQERLRELLARYPDAVNLSWELGTELDCNSSDDLRALLASLLPAGTLLRP